MRIHEDHVSGDRVVSEAPHVKTIGGPRRPVCIIGGFARGIPVGGAGSADPDFESGVGTEANRVTDKRIGDRLNAAVAARAESRERVERKGGCGVANRDDCDGNEGDDGINWHTQDRFILTNYVQQFHIAIWKLQNQVEQICKFVE